MKMGPKTHAKSMKSRGCVADAILVRSGCQKAQKPATFWIPFCNHFRPKIQKNEKKMNTVIGHCPGALQERKKNDFWEARKTSCFLDGFFIENGLLLEAIFNEKTIQKSMLILNPKKSWFLMKNQCQNCLSFSLFFYLLCSFSKSAQCKIMY